MPKRAYFDKFEIVADCFSRPDNSAILADEHSVKLPTDPISSLHYHNMLEIGICTSESGLFYSHLNSEFVNKGDLIFFLPGVAHFSQSLHADSPCVCKFIFIDTAPLLFSLFKEYESEVMLISDAHSYNIPPIIRESEHPEAHKILSALMSDALADIEKKDFFVSMHLAEFLMKLPSFFNKNEALLNKTEGSEDILFTVEAFISAHYNEPLTSERLCDVCGLSASQLRRRYKEKFGVSPMKYMHLLRCNIGAQLLLHTSMTIGQISEKIGYFDSSEFYKHFQSAFDCSPSTYKKQKNK